MKKKQKHFDLHNIAQQHYEHTPLPSIRLELMRFPLMRASQKAYGKPLFSKLFFTVLCELKVSICRFT